MKGTKVSGTAEGDQVSATVGWYILTAAMFGVMTFALLLQGAGSWGELYLQEAHFLNMHTSRA